MKTLFLILSVITLLIHPAISFQRDGYASEPAGIGRRLKLFGGDYGFGGTVRFRSNNQAFSASLAVSPSYLATLITDEVGSRDGGVAAALAYAVDVRPENWYAYATGADVEDNLLRLLARGPLATTDAYLDDSDGTLTGEAYARARGNFVAFSRAYVHLLDEAEAEGIDLAARSQARGKAVSEKHRDDVKLRRLFGKFYDDYESEVRVLAVVDADVRNGKATAKQEAKAETDDYPGGKQCARVWLRGEAVKGVELTEEDLLVHGLDIDVFEC